MRSLALRLVKVFETTVRWMDGAELGATALSMDGLEDSWPRSEPSASTGKTNREDGRIVGRGVDDSSTKKTA